MNREDDGLRAHHLEPGVEERLDALSIPLAERVIRRAIELQDQAEAGPDRIGRPALEQIAAELGITATVVEQALLEELSTAAAGSTRERFLAPSRITGGRVVAGDTDSVAAAIDEWMTRQEGLRPRARTRAGVQWERDRNVFTRLRHGLKLSRGTGALRRLPSVTHRQTEVTPSAQLVEIDADSSVVSRTSLAVAGSVAAAAAGGGIAAAAGLPGGNDLLQFAVVAAPGLVVALSSALAVARGWAASIRRGIDRALDGIANPDLVDRSLPERLARAQRDWKDLSREARRRW